MRFLLCKLGDPNALQDVELAGDVAEFPIRRVSQRDSGNYSCRYSINLNQPIWSEPSNPVELVVAELPETKPSISVSPSGVIAPGAAVTIRCQCQCEARRLFLYKGGIEIRELDAAGDGGEFTIPSARLEDGGVYSCRSRSRSEPPKWSYPSEMVRIIVVELSYPKPSISLRPSWGVALGGAVTVRCRGLYQNVRFLLYKDGNPNVMQDMEPAGDLAEFPIRNVSRRDGGHYSCYYCSKLYPFIWSHPSDPVELVVAEPKPNITLYPSGQVAPGGAVTIWCECWCRGARFLLSKAGDPDARRVMDPMGDVAAFPIRIVSQGDAGNYSCQYSTKWDPPIWSEPSDPVELVVAGATDTSEPGMTLAPPHPGNAGPGTRAEGRKSTSTPHKRDYTRGNIVRLALGAGVLLALALMLAEAAHRWRRGGH
ncbi:leukocyte immunoglobulin-like receptor subfamily A member 5 [Trachemys scripta elegans]|uniref:leukocyte immunoglobulin-like receptor subfamily A member 5 n=1 Tax=Trachemys scripta elegans TaxID=31138 RepID=UPI001554DE3C|nr:leukocyte immunoglobulin-like receptor subfamily A member 5 [Trachemys scripta elegans]